MRRSSTWLIATGLLAVPAVATADLEIKAEVALEVNVLFAVNLPLVAHEARASGIAEQEVAVALSSAREGGVSAAEATEIVAAEVEETKKEGKPKDNFGQWVRQQVAQGVKGRELAQAIRERKAELAQSSDTDVEIKAKLAKQRDERRAYRAKVREKRKELLESGQKCAVRGTADHRARRQALAAARAELLSEGKNLGKAGRRPAKGYEHGMRTAAHAKAGDVAGNSGEARGQPVAATAKKARDTAHSTGKSSHAGEKTGTPRAEGSANKSRSKDN